MKKSFLSIVITLTLIINIFACTNEVSSASNKSTNEITNETTAQTETLSQLEKGIKELLEKDFIKSLMGDKSIHEIFTESLNQGVLKDLESSINKSISDISINIENFKTDETTYAWLSNIIISTLKNALNKGLITQSDLDQINSTIGIFGAKKISVDLTKKDYTLEETEKVALELLPILDKLLNPVLLKFAGVDLASQKFWEDLINQLPLKQ